MRYPFLLLSALMIGVLFAGGCVSQSGGGAATQPISPIQQQENDITQAQLILLEAKTAIPIAEGFGLSAKQANAALAAIQLTSAALNADYIALEGGGNEQALAADIANQVAAANQINNSIPTAPATQP